MGAVPNWQPNWFAFQRRPAYSFIGRGPDRVFVINQ